jgi:small subunit ribosomal protein S5
LTVTETNMAEETTNQPTEAQPQPAPEAQAPAEAAAPAQAAPAAEGQAPPAPHQPDRPHGGGGGGGGGGGRGGRGGGRGGPQGGGRGRGPRRDDRGGDESGIESAVVRIYRCSKVVKGGRTFSFGALVVAGDRRGNVGIGYGKANEVPDAIKKSTEHARKRLVNVKLKGDTIPHDVLGCYDGGKVLLKPASPGTGLIAGGGVRAVLEAAGVKNILTKSMGSKNHIAVVHATLDGLRQLKLAEEYQAIRKSS